MNFRNNDKDWLLTVSKVLLIPAEIGFVLALIGIALGIIAHLTFAREKVFADLAAAGAHDGTYVALIGLLALVWLTLSLSMLFVRQLRGVIDSVGRGDPFEPANATRLTGMGWYALGVQACQWTMEPILSTYGPYASSIGGADGVTSGSDASLTALALALTLFILARVFRHGTAMRDDLEGTV